MNYPQIYRNHRCPNRNIWLEFTGIEWQKRCFACGWIGDFSGPLPQIERDPPNIKLQRTYGFYTCKGCGRNFLRRSPTQTFHSRDCQMEHRKRKP